MGSAAASLWSSLGPGPPCSPDLPAMVEAVQGCFHPCVQTHTHTRVCTLGSRMYVGVEQGGGEVGEGQG